jgi:hypothetical protein
MSEEEDIPSEREAEALLQTVKALTSLVGEKDRERCHVEMPLRQQMILWTQFKRIENGRQMDPEGISHQESWEESWETTEEFSDHDLEGDGVYPMSLWGIRVRTGDTLGVVTRHEGEEL